jgi:transketolase
MNNNELIKIARDYREKILHIAHEHMFGIHLGGSLSIAEILSVLYFHELKLDSGNPDWPLRDRFVLSKGHANIGLLTILSLRGFIPEDFYEEFNKLGSPYTMHADAQVDGVEHSAGSLGHGLPVSVGMALVGKRASAPWRVFCLLGDGEMMEGSNWEALMSASHYQLSNLTAIIDRNFLSQSSKTEKAMSLSSLEEKVKAFGWSVYVIDGHNIAEIMGAFSAENHGKPKMVIAQTKKGKGVPSLEDNVGSHFGSIDENELSRALQILEE